MPDHDLPSWQYFRLLAQVRQAGSTTDDLIRLANLGITAIDRFRVNDARKALAGLKLCLDQIRSQIDGEIEIQHKNAMEVMTLRKENLELARLLAIAQHDEIAAAALGETIEKMNEFFSAAIADMDPGKW